MRSCILLQEAIISGKEEEVRSLLEKKASVQKEREYFTPLMRATEYRHTNIIQLLLAYKADINQTTARGRYNALYIAVRDDNIICTRLLINCNAHLPTGTEPALHTAAIKNSYNVARILLKEYKVDINQTDERKNTALMSAAYLGNVKVAQVLLESENIDLDCKDIEGKTARDVAVEKKHDEVVKILDEAALKRFQHVLIFGLFGSEPSGSRSTLKTLSQDPIFDRNTVKIIYEFLRPNNQRKI